MNLRMERMGRSRLEGLKSVSPKSLKVREIEELIVGLLGEVEGRCSGSGSGHAKETDILHFEETGR